ncbi:hypothetical protein DXG01_011173 [Tephrocybe rancida]|nr:hypothetical protein DXG01_011173 [Tephrocybe rancida]
MDASDFVLGVSLQQVQDMTIVDLKGTPLYSRLAKAWEDGLSTPPTLVPTLMKDVEEGLVNATWGDSLN